MSIPDDSNKTIVQRWETATEKPETDQLIHILAANNSVIWNILVAIATGSERVLMFLGDKKATRREIAQLWADFGRDAGKLRVALDSGALEKKLEDLRKPTEE